MSLRCAQRPPMDRCWSTANAGAPVVRTFDVPNGPAELRIAFASDFHLRASMDPDALLAPIAAAEPDMVLLGGDYADSREQALRLFEAMRALRPELGIYCAIGNNDREAFDDIDALQRAMDRFGGRLLVNESVNVGNLAIGGIDEYKHGAPRYEGIFPDPARWLLLLSHYPILPDAPKETWPRLMLSGHTHGGQFNLFGMTPYSVFFECGARRPALISGMAQFGPTTLITSKGIGCSRLPLRIGVESEICLIRMKRAET